MLENTNTALLPFLKWAGGKRWLTSSGCQIVPNSFNNYIEPFLGSGAVLFSSQCYKGVLSDINHELITTYQSIQSEWAAVTRKLTVHARNHSDDYYYKIRSSNPISETSIAARFIYLNRTCWNGLYRVNLKGEFNVPRGTKNSVILDTDDFQSVSARLANFKIVCSDFETSIDSAGKGDFLFVDPPYTVKHNHNGFIKYNEKIFRWEDQIRLFESIERAVSRGVKATITNADHISIRELYSNLGEIVTLNRKSVLAGNSVYRGNTSEILVRAGWLP